MSQSRCKSLLTNPQREWSCQQPPYLAHAQLLHDLASEGGHEGLQQCSTQQHDAGARADVGCGVEGWVDGPQGVSNSANNRTRACPLQLSRSNASQTQSTNHPWVRRRLRNCCRARQPRSSRRPGLLCKPRSHHRRGGSMHHEQATNMRGTLTAARGLVLLVGHPNLRLLHSAARHSTAWFVTRAAGVSGTRHTQAMCCTPARHGQGT